MDSDILEVFYCENDGEYRVYCNVCDKLCIERFYRNHLKSQTHTDKIHGRKRFKEFYTDKHEILL